MSNKERTSDVCENISEHLRKIRNFNTDVRHYFYWDSPVMKAIKKHLLGDAVTLITFPQDYCNLDMEVRTCSAGPSIRFRNAYAADVYPHLDSLLEPDFFYLEITVNFVSENDEVDKDYIFKIPIDLEENFDQEKFDIWAKQEGEKFFQTKKRKDLPVLEKLMKLYPEEVKRLIS